MLKDNFINSKIQNSVEYYRTSIYDIYYFIMTKDMGDISGHESAGSEEAAPYYSWVDGKVRDQPEPEAKKEEKTKK